MADSCREVHLSSKEATVVVGDNLLVETFCSDSDSAEVGDSDECPSTILLSKRGQDPEHMYAYDSLPDSQTSQQSS